MRFNTIGDDFGKYSHDMSKKKNEIRKLANEFEAILFSKMISSMRESITESNFINTGRAEKIFRSMLDDQLALRLALTSDLGVANFISNNIEDKTYDK